MKKLISLCAALALAAGLSAIALAAPASGQNAGGGMGYGWSQITPEQRAEAQKAHSEFLTQTLALRQNLAAKRAELQTLYAQPNPDHAKIKGLADEVIDLSAQLAKKRNEFAAKYPNSYGRFMGGGYQHGMMGDFGYGGGMRGGSGYGGMMGGYGYDGDMMIQRGGSN